MPPPPIPSQCLEHHNGQTSQHHEADVLDRRPSRLQRRGGAGELHWLVVAATATGSSASRGCDARFGRQRRVISNAAGVGAAPSAPSAAATRSAGGGSYGWWWWWCRGASGAGGRCWRCGRAGCCGGSSGGRKRRRRRRRQRRGRSDRTCAGPGGCGGEVAGADDVDDVCDVREPGQYSIFKPLQSDGKPTSPSGH